MDREFTIQLSIKTLNGFTAFGGYDVDMERVAAIELFNTLKGNHNHAVDALLFVDLVEKVGGLPVAIRAISCTLDELAYNTRLIVKEIFKQKNLTVTG